MATWCKNQSLNYYRETIQSNMHVDTLGSSSMSRSHVLTITRALFLLVHLQFTILYLSRLICLVCGAFTCCCESSELSELCVCFQLRSSSCFQMIQLGSLAEEEASQILGEHFSVTKKKTTKKSPNLEMNCSQHYIYYNITWLMFCPF